MKLIRPLIYVFFAILLGCSKDDPADIGRSTFDPSAWLVPKDEVIDAGLGKDGIPALDNPQFSTPQEIGGFFDDQLVLGIEHNGALKAYPMPILDWHEIVNDEINGLYLAVTYCPLTGTAVGWERKIGEVVTTFGVSGLLYNNNLMPYDRRTNSTWSQQRLECVNGSMVGRKPKTYNLIETTFATWKKAFPDFQVMNANTGFDRRYSLYPYGDYRENHELLFFPLSQSDGRLPAKERVLGVIGKEVVKAFRFNDASEGTKVMHDEMDGNPIVVVVSGKDNYNTVFYNPEQRQFKPEQNGLPVVMKDERGNSYDLAGRIIAGPDTGTKLDAPTAFIGYWFSWTAFYPAVQLYGE